MPQQDAADIVAICQWFKMSVSDDPVRELWLLPKQLEQRLKREAAKKFPGDEERQDRYVYGTMNKLKKEGKIG